MRYLLDTNHAASLVSPKHPLRTLLATAVRNGDSFAITTPVVAEVIAGISILPRAVENRSEWTLLRPTLTLYDLDESDAIAAGDLAVAMRRKGWQLETLDALVAIVCLRYDLTLLTTDRDFSGIPDLRVENWR